MSSWSEPDNRLRLMARCGVANDQTMSLRGQVLGPKRASAVGTLLRDSLRAGWHARDNQGIDRTRVRLTTDHQTAVATTNARGEFRFDLSLAEPFEPWRGMHAVTLELEHARNPVRAQAWVVTAPRQADFVVVSDVDGVLMRTGASGAMWSAASALLHHGHATGGLADVAKLLWALHRGVGGRKDNPVCYLSGVADGLYAVVEALVAQHGAPEGPVFLRERGAHLDSAAWRSERRHKLEHIERLTRLWPDKPLVLVGAASHAELYQQVVERNPDRICAIVAASSPRESRERNLLAIKAGVGLLGVPMVIATSVQQALRDVARLELAEPLQQPKGGLAAGVAHP